jgi:hypothetical protein
MDPTVISIAMIVITAALSFAGAVYWARRTERGKQIDRIVELERKLSDMSQMVQPLSAAFQAVLIKQLTHFHTPVLDKLMQGIGPPLTLTPAEEQQLIEELKKRTQDMDAEISESEREAAIMLPLVIKRVRLEQKLTPASGKLMVVIAPVHENETPTGWEDAK